jgi:hypothetical protein
LHAPRGIYGVGGGSLLGPILVGTGMTVATVAPAALRSTVVTSITGALTYALLSVITSGAIAPKWPLGIACGLGGLIGGYLGALLQPHMPDTALQDPRAPRHRTGHQLPHRRTHLNDNPPTHPQPHRPGTRQGRTLRHPECRETNVDRHSGSATVPPGRQSRKHASRNNVDQRSSWPILDTRVARLLPGVHR